jgi:hypothetical protein
MAMCYADGICTAKPKWRYSTIVSPGKRKRISRPPGRSEFHSDLKDWRVELGNDFKNRRPACGRKMAFVARCVTNLLLKSWCGPVFIFQLGAAQ